MNKLENQEDNRKYYSHSDGNFMPVDQSLVCHRYLDRVAFVRDWVHKLFSERHIDIGTKDGYLPLMLTAEGVESVGVDPSEDAIAMAIFKAQQAGYDIEYIVAYAEDLKIKEKFDTCSCLEVIEHVVDPDILLKALSSYADYVMISTPDANGRHGKIDQERNQEHLRVYTKEELENLVKKYGKIVDSVIRDDAICIVYKSKLYRSK